MRSWFTAVVLALALAGCQRQSPPRRPDPPPAVWVKCPNCKGEGWVCHDGVCKKCKRCAGSGKVPLANPAPPDDTDRDGKRRRKPRG